jgi:hypothetical protein
MPSKLKSLILMVRYRRIVPDLDLKRTLWFYTMTKMEDLLAL